MDRDKRGCAQSGRVSCLRPHTSPTASEVQRETRPFRCNWIVGRPGGGNRNNVQNIELGARIVFADSAFDNGHFDFSVPCCAIHYIDRVSFVVPFRSACAWMVAGAVCRERAQMD